MMDTIAQVLSQAVAFFLFLWILKKYAWGPILGLIDERNQKIEAGFKRAEDAEARSMKLQQEYEARLLAIESEAREKINQAVNEGRRTAEEIHERARLDAQVLMEKARDMAHLEIEKARVELKDDIVRYTLAAAEKLIHEKLDEASHRRLVEEFVVELSERK